MTEKSELHKSVWQVSEDSRGSLSAWDFKNYFFALLFYKFLSKMNLFLGEDESFESLCERASDDVALTDTLEGIFANIESNSQMDSPKGLGGLFSDMDLNSNRLGSTTEDRNKQLAKMLRSINEIDFDSVDGSDFDIFGDIYEYLHDQYTLTSGSKGGEFYTPQSVADLLTRIVSQGKQSVRKVYDPTCGSGSLLLRFLKNKGKDFVKEGFYGQEINLTTHCLARINMFLHGLGFDKFDIHHGNTLSEPYEWSDEDKFDAIVSNPPYSISWEGKANKELIKDRRFAPAGVVAPKSKADLAFLMHCVDRLADDGTAAIVMFPGALYRGHEEAKIRQHLLEKNLIDAVIQLPENLFFGTTIETSIVILEKNRDNDDVFFVDARKQFEKREKQNVMLPQHLDKIMEIYNERVDIAEVAKSVHRSEVINRDGQLIPNLYQDLPSTNEKMTDLEFIKSIDAVKQAEIERSKKVTKFDSKMCEWAQALLDAEEATTLAREMGDKEVKFSPFDFMPEPDLSRVEFDKNGQVIRRKQQAGV